MRIGPVVFLFVVAASWAGVRALMLWPETRAPAAPRRIAWQPPLDPPFAEGGSAQRAEGQAAALPVLSASLRRDAPATTDASVTTLPSVLLVSTAAATTPRGESLRTSVAPIFPPQPGAERSRLSLSSWAIVRGEAGPGLASAGQLGGSQAGVRARYDLGSGFAAAMRVSAPFRSRFGKEAAVALDWRPVRRVPVTVTVERRAGLDRGGRDAFAFGVFGGAEVSLPLGLRADGYGQAGIVGVNRQDVYIDGALRMERTLISSGRLRIAVGGGGWGGAQPGASRLDVGPQLVAHVPVGRNGLRIGAEWRLRIAGHARPGSGPALSIGADF